MALKDDLNVIKQRVDSEEQFLENMIRTERFFVKYKKLIIVIIAIFIIAGGYIYVKNLTEQNRILKANEAYSELILNPNNKDAIDMLKSKDINLYALYKFRTSIKDGNLNDLEELNNLDIDPLLRAIINFGTKNGSDGFMQDYIYLTNGFLLLKENKISEAQTELAKIPANSSLYGISKKLLHYNGYKK